MDVIRWLKNNWFHIVMTIGLILFIIIMLYVMSIDNPDFWKATNMTGVVYG